MSCDPNNELFGDFDRQTAVANEVIAQAAGRADVIRAAAHEKRLANLRARCALQGVQLFATTDDHGKLLVIVTKWALTYQMHSLDEVAAWVHRIDGQQE